MRDRSFTITLLPEQLRRLKALATHTNGTLPQALDCAVNVGLASTQLHGELDTIHIKLDNEHEPYLDKLDRVAAFDGVPRSQATRALLLSALDVRPEPPPPFEPGRWLVFMFDTSNPDGGLDDLLVDQCFDSLADMKSCAASKLIFAGYPRPTLIQALHCPSNRRMRAHIHWGDLAPRISWTVPE